MKQGHTDKLINLQKPLLKKELLTLYDEFSEFTDQCAFLCDAFAATAANYENLDKESAKGLDHNAYWLKQKVKGFKVRLQLLNSRL